jgi:ParB/RepB/Spo0J family partition protein
LIRPSDHPIRQSWDEEKMAELTQSIVENGVIVPIKVQPVEKVGFKSERGQVLGIHQGYSIVYGHRRVEAARRAGLAEIPAIVDELDDQNELIQALIENVQREDMTALDMAKAIKRLKIATQWTDEQIAHSLGYKASGTIATYNALLIPEIEAVIKNKTGLVSTADVHQARAGTDSDTDAATILRKAINEDLSKREIRAAADAYTAADTPELKEAVLKTSGKLGDKDAILSAARMKIGAEKIADRRTDAQVKAAKEYERAVADFMDAVKLFDKMIKIAQQTVKVGNFSPEGAKFTARRIKRLIESLEALKEDLEHAGQ